MLSVLHWKELGGVLSLLAVCAACALGCYKTNAKCCFLPFFVKAEWHNTNFEKVGDNCTLLFYV